jgi:hypothetical protein
MAFLLVLSIILAWTLWGPQTSLITQLLWTKQGYTQVTIIEQGCPINNQMFLLDFNRSTIVLPNDRASSGWDSAFYVHPLFGDMDAFVFAGTRYELPFTVNYGEVISSRCQQCDGIFGLGRGSPILDFYTSMSVGGFVTVLDEYSLRADNAQKHAAACNFGSQSLCDLQVRITRIDGRTGVRKLLSNNTLLLLAPSTPETLLPNQVFLDTVAGMNTVKDGMNVWPDLEFCVIGGAIADGSDVCFTIPRQLVLPTDRSYSELAIAPSDADYAKIGFTVLRGLTVHYFLKSNSVGFSAENVVLSVGSFSILCSIFAIILLYCLAFTRTPILPPSAIANIRPSKKNVLNASYAYAANVRQIIEAVALIILPLMVLIQDAPGNLWASSPFIAIGVLVILIICWFSGLYAQFQYKAADVSNSTFSTAAERMHLARVAILRSATSIAACIIVLLIFSMETFANGKVTMLMLLLSITLNLILLRTVLVLLQLAFVYWTYMTFVHVLLWAFATLASYLVTSAEIATPMMRSLLTNGNMATWATPVLFGALIFVLALVFHHAQTLYFLHFIETGKSILLNSQRQTTTSTT